MWELGHKEDRTPKNWCFRTVVLEKTLESPLDCKIKKPVDREGNQLWILTGRTDAEADAVWPPDANSPLTGKDPDAGKDWRQEEKRETGWQGWMASPIQCTWTTWENYRRWWRTGKPGMLQSMGSQRVRHDLAMEQQQKKGVKKKIEWFWDCFKNT